jgi:proteasome accessory factor B
MQLSSRPPLARIMAIDQALRAGTWPNATTLAGQLEVTARTIRRDITYLRDQLRAPVEFDPVRNGYRYTEANFRLPFFQLTEGELVSMLLAERVLRQYRGTPFERDLSRAFAKVTDLLPDAISLRLDQMADCLSVMPAVQISYDPETFATLASAVVRRRRVKMVYWTAGRNETRSRLFDPYHLTLIDDGWFVIGHCYYRREILVFAVQRVRSIREEGETFDLPADFRVEDYMGDSFRALRGEGRYRVVLRFTPEFAGRIAEKVWHRSQTSETANDGGLIVRFEVSDLREVKRWVMFWGTDCEVLEPNVLIEQIKEACRANLGRS